MPQKLIPYGDWERRTGTVAEFYRTDDLVALDVHLEEARNGVVRRVRDDWRVPYVILRAAGKHRGFGGPYVDPEEVPTGWHPLLWLWSCLRYHETEYFPPRVRQTLEQIYEKNTLQEEKTFKSKIRRLKRRCILKR